MNCRVNFWAALIAVSVAFVACSEDYTIDYPFEGSSSSKVEQIEGLLRSTFYLPPVWGRMAESDISLIFKPRGSGGDQLFEGKVTVDSRATVVFDIDPDRGHHLPTGDYVLVGYVGGRMLPVRFLVQVRNSAVQMVRALHTYSGYNGGNGSKEEPYEIATKKQFKQLMYDLADDEDSYGYGLYFLQTADFDLYGGDDFVAEEGWVGEPFAGVYDGGGFAINNVHYDGALSNIGLFRELYWQAEIKNLHLDIKHMITTGDNVGALAGTVYDDVKIVNCTISGNIGGRNNVGGIAGRYYRTDNPVIRGIDLEVDIESTGENAGGLIGYIYGGDPLTITRITTIRRSFTVKGHNYVGGLVGYCDRNGLTIENANLVHSSYATTSTLTVIGGNDYVGGLVGHFYYSDSDYIPLEIINSSTCCTVRATGSYVGGIIGYAHGSSSGVKERINLTEVSAASSVSGKDYVGGLIGYASSSTLNFVDCSVSSEKMNAINVEGERYVGGALGGFNASSEAIDLYIGTNVSASNEGAGGYAGYACYPYDDMSSLQFAHSLVVTAPTASGGVYGYMQGGDVWADMSVNYGDYSKIPKERDQANVSMIVKGASYVGGVAGKAYDGAQIRQIHARCTVSGSEFVGGLVGYLTEGKIDHCTASGTITGSGNFTGGMAGVTENSSITQSINYATVTGEYHTGGVTGYANAINNGLPYIGSCVNTGAVTGKDVVGGVVGVIFISRDDLNLIVKDCANFGKVQCNSGTMDSFHCGYGGIVGNSPAAGAKVEGCANHAKVSGDLNCHGGGGIAGSMGNDPSGAFDSKDANNFAIVSCVNTGEVCNQKSDPYLGGILGFAEEGDDGYSMDAAIIACFNLGKISSKQSTAAGIVGYLDWYGQIEYCCCAEGFDGDNDYPYWYDGEKSVMGISENRVRNNVVYKEGASADAYSALSTSYWDLSMTTGKPVLLNCPFQHTTF